MLIGRQVSNVNTMNIDVFCRYLVNCMQFELQNTMHSFLVDNDDDVNDDGMFSHIS